MLEPCDVQRYCVSARWDPERQGWIVSEPVGIGRVVGWKQAALAIQVRVGKSSHARRRCA